MQWRIGISKKGSEEATIPQSSGLAVIKKGSSMAILFESLVAMAAQNKNSSWQLQKLTRNEENNTRVEEVLVDMLEGTEVAAQRQVEVGWRHRSKKKVQHRDSKKIGDGK